ncbi:hypothetical protein ACFFLM_08020 [Deinococcus oregonensis]|uniref:Uncharacterized protein n=1 Tax=Deinococcus oregonensis TaxID=1805970 RepID=A0ABV6B0B7_9DEIO
MGKTVTEVIKIVAPALIQGLATAAENLLAEVGQQAKGKLHLMSGPLSDQDYGTVIFDDTSQYITSQFANTYGYYYEGMRSQPVTGALPIAASLDIIVYDPNSGLGNIQDYLQQVFKDSISPSNSIEIANNLSQLFLARFKELDLSWTPFNKRFNFPDGTMVDCYMVTAAARDTTNNPAGVVTYCFVAYSSK